MRYRLSGTLLQTLEIDLAPGETVYSQTNSMCWMNDAIEMDTNTGGGFFAGLQRTFGGGSFFVTEFRSRGEGHVAFAPRFPGTILPLTLRDGQSLICRKETFLCAEITVRLELAWQQKFGAGLFGGEGFILQRVTGPGTVWLDLSGEVVERDLAPGERLLVNAGHVGAIDPSVSFDIQMVKGFRNILFGGEGLFLATSHGTRPYRPAKHADHESGRGNRPLSAGKFRRRKLRRRRSGLQRRGRHIGRDRRLEAVRRLKAPGIGISNFDAASAGGSAGDSDRNIL